MAIIRKYKAIVEKIINPFPDIFTVTFSSKKKFQYLPGQFLHLALDEYDGVGQWPESRCFSMQSCPNEELIKITFAVQGKFTKLMSHKLHERKEVWLKMSYGDIFQREFTKNNCVFISGGTGLTPFLSLFTDSSFSGYENPVLYAGFRNIKYNLFNDELAAAKGINNDFNIKTIYQDQRGMLDIEKIYNIHRDTVYFISGPPIMIKNFKNYLLNKGVEDSRVITDDWA